ncbi:uncharacterized protein EV422DRAFT_429762 [Fimicolochytrium jonesii]|uniref:uncharacterized protein n=1 Tax=Fimicolochytrium jonesii TaxID=1396493 RepID=UPI0022FF105D|nr:uncharacterized protein EV422DRAFT_429762 [Fimicolochytrium jonesii]KAI8821731.1 hypothetical protein EV422DRAFT_429762 [Fimicolochytrium jonesii]
MDLSHVSPQTPSSAPSAPVLSPLSVHSPPPPPTDDNGVLSFTAGSSRLASKKEAQMWEINGNADAGSLGMGGRIEEAAERKDTTPLDTQKEQPLPSTSHSQQSQPPQVVNPLTTSASQAGLPTRKLSRFSVVTRDSSHIQKARSTPALNASFPLSLSHDNAEYTPKTMDSVSSSSWSSTGSLTSPVSIGAPRSPAYESADLSQSSRSSSTTSLTSSGFSPSTPIASGPASVGALWRRPSAKSRFEVSVETSGRSRSISPTLSHSASARELPVAAAKHSTSPALIRMDPARESRVVGTAAPAFGISPPARIPHLHEVMPPPSAFGPQEPASTHFPVKDRSDLTSSVSAFKNVHVHFTPATPPPDSEGKVPVDQQHHHWDSSYVSGIQAPKPAIDTSSLCIPVHASHQSQSMLPITATAAESLHSPSSRKPSIPAVLLTHDSFPRRTTIACTRPHILADILACQFPSDLPNEKPRPHTIAKPKPLLCPQQQEKMRVWTTGKPGTVDIEHTPTAPATVSPPATETTQKQQQQQPLIAPRPPTRRPTIEQAVNVSVKGRFTVTREHSTYWRPRQTLSRGSRFVVVEDSKKAPVAKAGV